MNSSSVTNRSVRSSTSLVAGSSSSSSFIRPHRTSLIHQARHFSVSTTNSNNNSFTSSTSPSASFSKKQQRINIKNTNQSHEQQEDPFAWVAELRSVLSQSMNDLSSHSILVANRIETATSLVQVLRKVQMATKKNSVTLTNHSDLVIALDKIILLLLFQLRSPRCDNSSSTCTRLVSAPSTLEGNFVFVGDLLGICSSALKLIGEILGLLLPSKTALSIVSALVDLLIGPPTLPKLTNEQTKQLLNENSHLSFLDNNNNNNNNNSNSSNNNNNKNNSASNNQRSSSTTTMKRQQWEQIAMEALTSIAQNVIENPSIIIPVILNRMRQHHLTFDFTTSSSSSSSSSTSFESASVSAGVKTAAHIKNSNLVEAEDKKLVFVVDLVLTLLEDVASKNGVERAFALFPNKNLRLSVPFILPRLDTSSSSSSSELIPLIQHWFKTSSPCRSLIQNMESDIIIQITNPFTEIVANTHAAVEKYSHPAGEHINHHHHHQEEEEEEGEESNNHCKKFSSSSSSTATSMDRMTPSSSSYSSRATSTAPSITTAAATQQHHREDNNNNNNYDYDREDDLFQHEQQNNINNNQSHSQDQEYEGEQEEGGRRINRNHPLEILEWETDALSELWQFFSFLSSSKMDNKVSIDIQVRALALLYCFFPADVAMLVDKCWHGSKITKNKCIESLCKNPPFSLLILHPELQPVSSTSSSMPSSSVQDQEEQEQEEVKSYKVIIAGTFTLVPLNVPAPRKF